MTTIVTRSGKGSPLTTGEVDTNFTNLNTDKAEVNSPTLTGIPAAPTATVGTSTTQIATTEFVITNAANTSPLMDGAVAIGTSTRHARADHVHPIDTTRAPVNSPTFTGTVTIPSGASIAGFAPLASPAFTGTVTGITKAMIGLGNADDTSDINKPISTATQNALNLKSPIASPTFTGTVTIPSLIVNSSMTITSQFIELGSTSVANWSYIDFHSSGTSSDFDVRIHSQGGSGTAGQGTFVVDAVGATFNCPITSTGDITAFSDERLKTEIHRIKGALERVLSWQGHTFIRKSDKQKSRGVIAQQIQSITPELVVTHSDGMLSVNYMGMIGDIIEAIRELDEKIESIFRK